MISAFLPRPIVELRQRDKSKIESVLSHGDRVFVGLNTGSLRIYSISETATEAAHAELRREVERFSRKPIQQLSIIKDASVLVSLSDGYVSFHDLESYNLSERLERTKGATLFATTRNIVDDPDTGIPSIVSRLVVAVRRKLLLWTWQDMELDEDVREFTMAAAIKSITWARSSIIVVGMDPGFSMVDVETSDISDVNRATESAEAGVPSGTRFGALSASGMGYMGMSNYLPKPMATKLSEDMLLLAKDVNTLFTDGMGKPLEKRQVPWATTPESIGYSYPYLLSLQQTAKGQLDLRNPDTLSLLQSIPLTNANLLHVPQPNISLAHAGKGFLVASERCIWRMDAVKYGPQLDELLEQTEFDEALSLANLIEDTLLLDKYERIHDIKMRKAYYLFDQRSYRESMELFVEAEARPHVVVALYPRSIAATLADENRRILEGRDLLLAVHELRAFLAQTRVKLQKYIDYDGNLKQPYNTWPKDELPSFANLVDQDESTANFDWREKLLETATLVDTTLFRAYMLVSPSLAGSLFRLDNFCAAEVVEDKLYESGRYGELIDYLHGKKLHEEALKLLERLGKGNDSPDEFQGPSKIIKYLQQLPFEQVDLILQYVKWPLQEDPALGMEVFLADTDNAEYLPRTRVLKFLQEMNPNLVERYLEHVINELHDHTPTFHDQLAQIYLRRIKESKATDRVSISEQEKLEQLLRDSAYYNKGAILKQLSTDDERFFESRATVLCKLTRHKEALEIYVYSMADYKKAEEYCNRVYATATGSAASKTDPHDTQTIYTILLSLFLKPKQTHAQNFEAALRLLSIYGSRLPALETLSELPHELPIKELERYFRTRMRGANSLAREQAVVASLRNVDKAAAESDLLLGREWDSRTPKKEARDGRSRRVILSEDMVCSACNKRFGRAAARLWPDGRIAHYGCAVRDADHGNM